MIPDRRHRLIGFLRRAWARAQMGRRRRAPAHRVTEGYFVLGGKVQFVRLSVKLIVKVRGESSIGKFVGKLILFWFLAVILRKGWQ